MAPKRPNKKPKEAFLSHSSKNLAFSSRLAKNLTNYNVNTFYSRKHIVGAQEWHDEIGEALKRCDWFLLVLSPQAVNSKWVKHELIYALQQNRYRGRIVPILYKSCDINKLSWTLSGFQHIDFRKGFDKGIQALLSLWKIKYVSKPNQKRSKGK
jgi:hypothetical protein